MKWKNTLIYDITADVYRDIKDTIIASEPIIDEELRQIFAQSGKGIRPLFTALAGGLVGGTWDDLRKAAMIIEAVHIASLIHDDVVDGSNLRRGKATLNARFSDKTSVLFGDYIFTKALSEAHTIGNPEALRIIYEAVERMIKGEIHESLREIIDEEAYLRIIGNKTASLFAASGELGIVLSGGNDIEKRWARELGESVGMAFQIIDDTLDFTGETEVMGKPRLADVISGRITLPVIHSFKSHTPGEIKELFSDKEGTVEKITALVISKGGIEYAYQKAREFLNNAQEILQKFNDTEAVSGFDDFFDMLMTRAS